MHSPPEAFVSHRNALLSEVGRLRLARCVVDEHWPLRRAAERFQVWPTAAVSVVLDYSLSSRSAVECRAIA